MWSALYPSAVGVVCRSRCARSTVAGLALIKLTRLRQHAGRAVAPSAHGPRGRGASPPIIRLCAGGASFYAGGGRCYGPLTTLSPGCSCNARGKTSSMCSTKTICRSRWMSLGISRRSLRLRAVEMNVLSPARCAASAFSLKPPISRTRPRKVISPVMATSRRAGRCVSAEISAVAMVMPAEGPSLGTALAGHTIAEARGTQVGTQAVLGHGAAHAPALGDAAGGLARDRADLALQIAHPGFVRILADDQAQRVVAKVQLLLAEAMLFELPRHQELARDGQLLILHVAGQLDRLHAVAQGRRDGIEHIGRTDEKHVAQIVRHVEVVVGEGV